MTDFEARHAKKAAKKGGAGKSQLLYPAAAHRVESQERSHRSLEPPTHLPDSFRRNWVRISHEDAAFRGRPSAQNALSEPLSLLSFELESSQPVSLSDRTTALVSRLVAPLGSAEFQTARSARALGRHSLPQVYPIVEEEFQIDLRRRNPPSEEYPGLKLLVSLQKLELSIPGPVEPLFATLSLWNVSTGEKLSEDFVCHLNTDATMQRLGFHPGPGGRYGLASRARAAIFSAPQRSKDVVLIALVTKTLRGETVDRIVDTYSSGKAIPAKVADDIQQLCFGRLGKFTQPLALSVIPLFQNDGSLASTASERQSLLGMPASLSRAMDADWIKSRLGGVDGGKRGFSVLPGVLQLSVESLLKTDGVLGRYSASGCALHPPGGPDARPTLEIRPFTSDPAFVWPQYEYENLLFVRPLMLHFSKFSSGALKGRNLLLRISLKDDDTSPLAPGLPIFFGRLGQSNDWVDSVTASVMYHERKPVFFEEFKANLPVEITPRHHLCFLIYHVNCKAANDGEELLSPVGFSFLPLAVGSNVIHDGLHQLFVSVSFPSNYLSPDASLQWLEKRPSLQVETRVHSALYPSDPHLRAFLHTVAQPTVVEAALGDLSMCGNAALVRSLPLVLDALFRTIALHNAPVGAAALEEMLGVLERVTEAKGGGQSRNELFESYIGFVLTLPKDKTSATVVYKLVLASIEALDNPRVSEHACRFAWFLCDAIIKWMFLVTDVEGNLAKSDRSDRFPELLLSSVEKLLQSFLRQLHLLSEERIGLARELGMAVSYFFLDLLCVMDRGFVTRQINYYLDRIVLVGATMQQKQLLDSIKIDTLRLICSHEHFVGLNAGRHTLISVLIRVVLDQQRSMDKAVRLTAMATLRNLLIKHALDARYASSLLKSRVAGMYFSFVGHFLHEREGFWDQYDLEEKRTALFCFLDIVKTSPMKMLTKWWASQSESIKKDFFGMLSRVMLTFEYRGRAHVQAMARDFTLMKVSRVKQLNAAILQGAGSTLRNRANKEEDSSLNDTDSSSTLRSWKTKVSTSPRGRPTGSGGNEGDASGGEQLSSQEATGSLRSWKKHATSSSPQVYDAPAESSTLAALDAQGNGGSLRSWKKQAVASSSSPLSTSPASSRVPVPSISLPSDVAATSEGGLAEASMQGSSGSSEVRSWKKQIMSASPRSPRQQQRQTDQAERRSITASETLGGNEPEEASRAGLRTWKKQSMSQSTPSSTALENGAPSSGSTDVSSIGSTLAASSPGIRSWRGKVAPVEDLSKKKGQAAAVSLEDVPTDLVAREENLSLEVLMTVLDIVMLYAETHRKDLVSGRDSILSSLFEVICHMLHVNQCLEGFVHLAEALRIFLAVFKAGIFANESSFAHDLTYHLMVRFSSAFSEIQLGAASLVYVLMKQNHSERSNCRRMALAATIGVNRLSEPLIKSPQGLGRFLEAMNHIVSLSRGQVFEEEVNNLEVIISGLLKNLIHIREFSYDKERLAELYFAMCENYRSSPDLHATWLHALAFLHETNGHYEEAAQCRLHLSALISKFLTLLKPKEAVPVDEKAFLQVAPNAGIEFEPPKTVALEDEGICTSDLFTRAGLFHQLQESVRLLREESLFESCIAVQRLVGSIHLRNRNWSALESSYADLSKLSRQVVSADEDHSRMFARWYRVNFFGSVLQEMAGTKWVYKERSETMISDMVDRIKHQFESAYGGPGNVHMLPNTAEIDETVFVPGHVYLQVSAVQPYLLPEDISMRTTDFEKQTNLCRFVMETPFTKSGTAHGDWGDQYLRRTVMSVAPNRFPFVTKRLPVAHEEIFILEPIDNALSVIQTRVDSLRSQNEAVHPSLKNVQQFLQGSVLLQVNPGPLAICQVFLDEDKVSLFPEAKVELLREAISHFIYESRALLLLNASLIDASQLDYQIALTEGYNDMRSKLACYIGSKPLAAQVEVPRT